MTNRHERRKAEKVSGVQMQRKVHQPSRVIEPFESRKNIEKWIEFGELTVLVDSNVDHFTDYLSFVITRIHDPYIFSASLKDKWQPAQLKAYYLSIGEYEGMQLDRQLENLSKILLQNISHAKEFYKRAESSRQMDPLYKDEMHLIEWAADLQSGIANLLNGIDQGEALKVAIEKHEADSMKQRREAQNTMKPKGGGRPTGATALTLEIGKRLISIWDKSKREQDITKAGKGLIDRLTANKERTMIEDVMLEKLNDEKSKGAKSWSNYLSRVVKAPDLESHS